MNKSEEQESALKNIKMGYNGFLLGYNKIDKNKNLMHLTLLNQGIKRCGHFYKYKSLYLNDQYFNFLMCQTLNLGLQLFCGTTDLKKFSWLPIQWKIKIPLPHIIKILKVFFYFLQQYKLFENNQ